jgi:hypothetical protein
MKNSGLNLSYDSLMKKTKLSSDPTSIERSNNIVLRPTHPIYFVICNSCYWCATYFGIVDLDFLSSQIISCHGCKSHNTELIPLRTDESFRIEYNHIRGVEIKFL